jgi:multidrug transporter EmrE-like cation transporter
MTIVPNGKGRVCSSSAENKDNDVTSKSHSLHKARIMRKYLLFIWGLVAVGASSIAFGIHLRYFIFPDYSISYPLWDGMWVLLYATIIAYVLMRQVAADLSSRGISAAEDTEATIELQVT